MHDRVCSTKKRSSLGEALATLLMESSASAWRTDSANRGLAQLKCLVRTFITESTLLLDHASMIYGYFVRSKVLDHSFRSRAVSTLFGEIIITLPYPSPVVRKEQVSNKRLCTAVICSVWVLGTLG